MILLLNNLFFFDTMPSFAADITVLRCYTKNFLPSEWMISKVMAKSGVSTSKTFANPEIDILIKDLKENDFRPPIGTTHSQYWKMKNLDSQKSKFLKIE